MKTYTDEQIVALFVSELALLEEPVEVCRVYRRDIQNVLRWFRAQHPSVVFPKGVRPQHLVQYVLWGFEYGQTPTLPGSEQDARVAEFAREAVVGWVFGGIERFFAWAHENNLLRDNPAIKAAGRLNTDQLAIVATDESES